MLINEINLFRTNQHIEQPQSINILRVKLIINIMNFKIAIVTFYIIYWAEVQSTQYYERRYNQYYTMEDINEIAHNNSLTRQEVMTSLDLVEARVDSPHDTSIYRQRPVHLPQNTRQQPVNLPTNARTRSVDQAYNDRLRPANKQITTRDYNYEVESAAPANSRMRGSSQFERLVADDDYHRRGQEPVSFLRC